MSKTCCFIGHSDFSGEGNIIKLKKEIHKLLSDNDIEFLNGGMGKFDLNASKIVCDLKKEYPSIQNNLVIAYLNAKIDSSYNYDNIIYPEIEKYPKKVAILYRNRAMVDMSDIAICYIERTWGGAYKTYQYANKKGIEVVNIYYDLN